MCVATRSTLCHVIEEGQEVEGGEGCNCSRGSKNILVIGQRFGCSWTSESMQRCTCAAQSVKGWMKVVLMAVAFGSIHVTQNILAPRSGFIPAEMDFGASLSQRSLPSLASLLTIPMGTLLAVTTDSPVNGSRRFSLWVLLGACSIIGAATSATSWQLFGYRLLSGIAMGGAFPVVFMILADMYPPEKRKSRAGLVGAFMLLGAMLGELAGNSLRMAYGWRVALVLLALPSLMLGLMVLHFVPQPLRGSQETALEGLFQKAGKGAYKVRLNWSSFCSSMTTGTNLLLVGQGVPGGIQLGVMWWYVHDRLAKDDVMVPLKTLDIIALLSITMLGAAFGSIGIRNQCVDVGGRDKFLWPLLLGASMIVMLPPMLLIVNLDYDQSHWPLALVSAFAIGTLGSINGTCVRTLLMNTNVPEVRGALLGMAHFATNIGLTIGPSLSRGILTALGSEVEKGVGMFNVSLVFWAIAGVLLLLGTLTVEGDQVAMEACLRRAVASACDAHGRHNTRHDMERSLAFSMGFAV